MKVKMLKTGEVLDDGAKYVNKPVVVNDIAEARKYFGYDDDWENYTLCEAMHVFFELVGVGPLVMINVLDPEKHKSDATKSKTLTPENGRMVIAGAESVILDTVKVGEKVLGTDYAMSYNYSEGHGEAWEKAFEAIHRAYMTGKIDAGA